MNLTAGLSTRLRQDAGVQAACASGGSIYPFYLPTNPIYPSVTYTTVSSVPDNNTNGPSGCVQRRIQFDFYGTNYMQCLALQDAIRVSLDGFKGTLPDGTYVFSAFEDNVIDFPNETELNTVYRLSSDYLILFSLPSHQSP